MRRTSTRAPAALGLLAATVLLSPASSPQMPSEATVSSVAPSRDRAAACQQLVADLLPYRVIESRQTGSRLVPESGHIEFEHTARARDGLDNELRFDYACSFARQGAAPVLVSISGHYL